MDGQENMRAVEVPRSQAGWVELLQTCMAHQVMINGRKVDPMHIRPVDGGLIIAGHADGGIFLYHIDTITEVIGPMIGHRLNLVGTAPNLIADEKDLAPYPTMAEWTEKPRGRSILGAVYNQGEVEFPTAADLEDAPQSPHQVAAVLDARREAQRKVLDSLRTGGAVKIDWQDAKPTQERQRYLPLGTVVIPKELELTTERVPYTAPKFMPVPETERMAREGRARVVLHTSAEEGETYMANAQRLALESMAADRLKQSGPTLERIKSICQAVRVSYSDEDGIWYVVAERHGGQQVSAHSKYLGWAVSNLAHKVLGDGAEPMADGGRA